MAKENDQTEDQTTDANTEEITVDPAELAEQKEAEAGVVKATETSKNFDAKIDEADVEETPEAETTEQPETKESKGEEHGPAKETKADKGKKEKADDKSADETESKISSATRKRAADLGVNVAEYAGYTEEDLIKTLDLFDKIMADVETEEKAEDKKPEAEAKEESLLKFKNEENIDPEILATLKAMDARHKTEIAGLKGRLQQAEENVQARHITEFTERFDKRIEDLGTEFQDVFGQGKTMDMSKREPALKARDAVRVRMHAIVDGLSRNGLEVPTEEEVFNLAIHALHGNKLLTVQAQRATTKANKTRGRGQAVGRAASQQTGDVSPTQKAYATSKAFDEKIDTSDD